MTVKGETESRELAKECGEKRDMGRVRETGGASGVAYRSEIVALEMYQCVGGECNVRTSASKEK